MKLFFTTLLALLSLTAFSQSTEAQKALRVYSEHKYSTAIPLLQNALSVEKNENTIAKLHFALGDSYAQNSQYELSLPQYEIAESKNYGPQATLCKALIQKILGQ